MTFEQVATIVGIILTILGLVAAVSIPIIRLLIKVATILGTIDERTIEMQKDIGDQRDISQRCSTDVHTKLTRHTVVLENHEGRIKTLETD